VEPGHNLLVTGPNTSGKSALFRVLGDLWPVRSGVVGKPGGLASTSQLKNVFLVPQKPYNVFGSLGDLITYPQPANLRDPQLLELLKIVRLRHLADRPGGLSAEENWSDVLRCVPIFGCFGTT
jgi:ABC-type uncharacterized transport system fused permease/ATPase subunit